MACRWRANLHAIQLRENKAGLANNSQRVYAITQAKLRFCGANVSHGGSGGEWGRRRGGREADRTRQGAFVGAALYMTDRGTHLHGPSAAAMPHTCRAASSRTGEALASVGPPCGQIHLL